MIAGDGKAVCCPESGDDSRVPKVSQTVCQKGKLDMDENRDKLYLAGHKGTFKIHKPKLCSY